LLGLLPARWRSWFQVSGKQLLIELDGQHCSIKSGPQSNPSPITSFELDAESSIPGILVQQLAEMGRKADKTILLLASERVLKKIISLPSATQNKLDAVLRFEMDRHTPFATDQVYFDYRLQPGGSAAGRINVELMLVTRAWLDPLLQQLKELGLSPSVVTPVEASAEPGAKRLNLLKGDKDSAKRSNRRLFRIQKGLVLLLLLVIGVGFVLYERKQRNEALEVQLDEPQRMAQRAQQAREQIKILKETRQFLTRKKAEEPVILYLLEELTRQLPDHTWLSRFEVKQGTVKLQGESRAASDLIGIIEQSEHFHDARFSSPVTINPRTQKERFVIVADIGPGDTP
jgi:general secretion pathway protein L